MDGLMVMVELGEQRYALFGKGRMVSGDVCGYCRKKDD